MCPGKHHVPSTLKACDHFADNVLLVSIILTMASASSFVFDNER